ncbi:M23 family metallopeptidase [Sanyastnella coralliicola]|uniref:M23 family metallopeptidase n=1 Tax=Sanyastnella coralliicola TaxID=3069118 RepID=UPI0027B8EB7C|nr:M23 family metallopeptidase [Longitalea sp. SCSIO 12813]
MLKTTGTTLTLSFFLLLGLNSYAQSTGGGFEESRKESGVTEKTLTDESIWDINDSLMHIPAYDDYCEWDTRNIHAYDFDYRELTDTVHMTLRHEECDYATPFYGRITSNFGERGARYHYGIDIKLYKGDPVKVAFEGLVRIAQYSRTYGNVVVVRHSNGLETLYAHLSARKVKPGDYVQAGDIIGLGGNTGRSTGSHLHFECRYKGEPIDPNLIINWETGELNIDELDLNAEHFAYLKEARAIKYHRIRSGDTLSGIARRYGTSVSAICRLNGMSRNSTIYAGRKIRIR